LRPWNSQEWPELHAATREARKAYQADGTMPDFDVLATLVAGHGDEGGVNGETNTSPE